MDASSVMAIKWQLGEKHTFVSGHRSGHVYFWNVEQSAGSSSSHTTKEIQDAKVKLFSKGHLVQRWKVSHGAVNAIAFSPDGIFMALACQDGFMRVYNVQKLEFHGRMRSHFGGFLCVCWSPDGKYVATGGEDDLATVWSFDECCVVTRCEGHSSWVNALSFDAVLCPRPTATQKPNHDEPTSTAPEIWESGLKSHPRSVIEEIAQVSIPAYRLGSVGQDGCLLLWDLTADALRVRRPHSRTMHRSRATLSECSDASSFIPTSPKRKERSVASESRSPPRGNSLAPNDCRDWPKVANSEASVSSSQIEMANVADWKNADLPAGDVRKHRKSNSTGGLVLGTLRPQKGQDKVFNGEEDAKKQPSSTDKTKSHKDGSTKMQKIVKKVSKKVALRSQVSRIPSSQGEMHQSDDVAPKMHEVNQIEPLITAHISPERLTDIHFTNTSILVACQHGFVQVWLRPGLLPHSKPSPELQDSI